MSLRVTLIGIFALLLGAGALNLGMGLQASLLGVRAGLEGFPTLLIGLIMSSYYAGFVVGSLLAPKIVSRVGHIRTFSAFASLASAAALCHAVFVDPLSWAIMRGLTGVCFAALCLVTESWLNERSSNLNRGTVLSIYFVVILASTAAGQAFLMMAPPSGYDLFIFVSVIISVALVPISLTSTPTPEISEPRRMALRRLYGISPVGVSGCFGAGLITGAFWALGAVYAQGKGLPTDDIAIFMTLVVGGGVVTQWPFGRLSDKMDRRYVIAGITIAIAALGAVAGLGLFPDGQGLYVLGALMGGLVLPLYGLVIAHANDFLEPEDFVPASASLLLLYGIGAVVGPMVATVVMKVAGPDGLFLHLGIAAALLAVFTSYRMTQRSAAPSDESADFVFAAQGVSPVSFELDPRAETEEGCETDT
ncbi:MFS transporter [Kordiimonas aestuarii]|uniref:MFS transporter n=1 Tax=Kordiimonas aestuarii TaxID=1005925 RepID=UPI0021CF7576|nr:MFS transporter [Kordiimonas aestuarii]